MNIALLTAGGVGSRMNMDIPKQFVHVNDKPLIIYTLEKFEKHADIDAIVVVCLKGWENILQAYAKQFNITKLKYIVESGENGQDSIRNGLFEIEKYFSLDDLVIIHDGNRAMVSAEIISDCIVKTELKGCAIAAIPTVEVVLYTENESSSTKSYPREYLKRTQTPHGFPLKTILNMHRQALEKGTVNAAASVDMAIALNQEVYLSLGSEKNLKITTMDDLDIFKALLNYEKESR